MAVGHVQLAIMSCMLAATRAGSEALNRRTQISARTSTSIISTRKLAKASSSSTCSWPVMPQTAWAWDPSCKLGDVGCNADGVHMECCFCGKEPYLPCPSCTSPAESLTPVVWDNRCDPDDYTIGCLADGVHFECRFCGAIGFDPCPTSTTMTTQGSTIALKKTRPGSHQDIGAVTPAPSSPMLRSWEVFTYSSRQLLSMLCWTVVPPLALLFKQLFKK